MNPTPTSVRRRFEPVAVVRNRPPSIRTVQQLARMISDIVAGDMIYGGFLEVGPYLEQK
jgi:hypothetical protein